MKQEQNEINHYIVVSKNDTDREMFIELIQAESYTDARKKSLENADKRGVSQKHIMTFAVPEGYTAVMNDEIYGG